MFWIFNFIFSFLASLFSVSYLMPLEVVFCLWLCRRLWMDGLYCII